MFICMGRRIYLTLTLEIPKMGSGIDTVGGFGGEIDSY